MFCFCCYIKGRTKFNPKAILINKAGNFILIILKQEKLKNWKIKFYHANLFKLVLNGIKMVEEFHVDDGYYFGRGVAYRDSGAAEAARKLWAEIIKSGRYATAIDMQKALNHEFDKKPNLEKRIEEEVIDYQI